MINKKKSNCGRPAGRIKTAKIEISIEPTVKNENQKVIKTPIVRNGKQATVGYQPDVWKNWK